MATLVTSSSEPSGLVAYPTSFEAFPYIWYRKAPSGDTQLSLGPLLTSPQSPLKVPSPSTSGHAGSFATLISRPSIWKLVTLLYPKTVAYKSWSSGDTDSQQSSAILPRLVSIGTTLPTPILPSSSMRHKLTPSPTAYPTMKVSGRLFRKAM